MKKPTSAPKLALLGLVTLGLTPQTNWWPRSYIDSWIDALDDGGLIAAEGDSFDDECSSVLWEAAGGLAAASPYVRWNQHLSGGQSGETYIVNGRITIQINPRTSNLTRSLVHEGLHAAGTSLSHEEIYRVSDRCAEYAVPPPPP